MSSHLQAAREAFAETSVQVYSGAGLLSRLSEVMGDLGIHRPLLVCGQQVSRLPAASALREAGILVGVFDRVEPDPSDRTVVAGGALARGLAADGIVAIGGGSSLDAAKAIAAEAVSAGWIGGCDLPGQPTEIPAGALPVVAVPTTAGTGSEVTPFAVITFTATRRKVVLNHPALLPQVALLDPTLLSSAPREARVAAGMDALTHAVESYVSRLATAETQARAREAVELIARHLPLAAGATPPLKDLAGMQRAALLAGLAFARTRLGIVHALALPLSALFGVPHGAANAVLLPHGMEFNLPAASHLYANLVPALIVNASNKHREGDPKDAVAAVRALAAEIRAPQRMREVGVPRAALPEMTEEAARSAHLAVNPRPAEKADLLAIYEAAY